MKWLRGNSAGKAEMKGMGFLVNPGQIDLGSATVADFAGILASFQPGGFVLGKKIQAGFQYVFTITGSAVASLDGTMPLNDYNVLTSNWNSIADGASRTYMMELTGTAQNFIQKLTRVDTGQVATRPYYSGAFQPAIVITPTVLPIVWPAMWAIDGKISASGLSGTNYSNGWFELGINKKVIMGDRRNIAFSDSPSQTQVPLLIALSSAGQGQMVLNSTSMASRFVSIIPGTIDVALRGYKADTSESINISWEVKGQAA